MVTCNQLTDSLSPLCNPISVEDWVQSSITPEKITSKYHFEARSECHKTFLASTEEELMSIFFHYWIGNSHTNTHSKTLITYWTEISFNISADSGQLLVRPAGSKQTKVSRIHVIFPKALGKLILFRLYLN